MELTWDSVRMDSMRMYHFLTHLKNKHHAVYNALQKDIKLSGLSTQTTLNAIVEAMEKHRAIRFQEMVNFVVPQFSSTHVNPLQQAHYLFYTTPHFLIKENIDATILYWIYLESMESKSMLGKKSKNKCRRKKRV